MAMKIHPGFKLPGKGLSTAAIMSHLAEKIVKGDEDAIDLNSLCQLTAETRENVIKDLQFLCDRGWLKLANGSWEEAGSIRIEKFSVTIGVDQRTLPVNRPAPPETASPTNRREETNEDYVTLGEHTYVGKMEYDGTQGDGVFSVEISTSDQKLPPFEDLVYLDTLTDASRGNLWRKFDNYIANEARSQTGEMEYIDADGLKWKFCVYPVEPAQDGVEAKPDTFLDVHKKEAGAESYSLFQEKQPFDTEALAWDYVDEFLEEPALQTPASSRPAMPWEDGKEPRGSGEFSTDLHPQVLWKHFPDWTDGNDWFYYLLGGEDSEESTLISYASAEIMHDKRPIEQVAEALFKDHEKTLAGPPAEAAEEEPGE